MEAQHTPGPWLVDQEYTDQGARINVVRNEAYDYVIGEYGVSLEDARLIAITPEMLEVLKAFIADEWSYMSDDDLAEELALGNEMVRNHITARALIAKARGQ